MEIKMNKVKEILNSSFWEPIVVPTREDFIPIQKALVAIGAFADQWISLTTRRVVWEKFSEVIDGRQITPIADYHPQSRDAKFCTDGSKFNTLVKVIKVISYFFLFPVSLIALGAKMFYRNNYINPFIASLTSFDIETKRIAVRDLSGWFEDHFPNSRGNCKIIHQRLYIDPQGKSDVEIGAIFTNLVCYYLIAQLSYSDAKPALSLRGLTLPKDNERLKEVVTFILTTAWRRIIDKSYVLDRHYAWANGGIHGNKGVASKDSWGILNEVLLTVSEEDQELIQNKQGIRFDNTTLHDKLDMYMVDTISVREPSPE